MKHGLIRTSSGSLENWVKGVRVSRQLPTTGNQWQPANINIINKNSTIGYRKVSQNLPYYWKVVWKNGKWMVDPAHKTKYYVKNGNKKFRVAPELK